MCARSDKVTNSSLFKHIVIILQQARHSMHTHAHTCVFDFTVQRTGEKNNNIYLKKKKSPFHKYVRTHHLLTRACCQIHYISNLPPSPKPCRFSQVTVQTMWFQPFSGKSGQRKGGESRDYKSLIFSHRIYTCTHDFNAHLQTFVSLHTRTLTQTICNIKCFKKYR